MTLHNFYRIDITCDFPLCNEEYSTAEDGHEPTDREARREAEGDGWTFVDRKDYCPRHNQENTDGN